GRGVGRPATIVATQAGAIATTDGITTRVATVIGATTTSANANAVKRRFAVKRLLGGPASITMAVMTIGVTATTVRTATTVATATVAMATVAMATVATATVATATVAT